MRDDANVRMTMTTNDSVETRPGWLTLNNRHTGERLHMRRVRRNGVTSLELSGTLPPNHDGPPLHVHFKEDEGGVVVTGTLAAMVDGVEVRVEKGGPVRLPMGSAHRWWNGGADTLQFDGVVTPLVDLDRFLAGIFDVMNAGTEQRPPVFYMTHLVWRYRKTQTVLIAPRWIQAVLFPTVVLVGTLLGRYRGTDWPGCPDRCGAAPLAS
jgi:mannose-6-phosphate isomerase-like protein (cupin superfamily)